MDNYKDLAFNLVRGKNFAFLCTINPDGTPQVTPTWVDTDGEYVLINTKIGTVKYRNIKRNPNVALAIAEQSDPYNMVTIKGKVTELLTGPVPQRHIHQLAYKYLGLEKNPWSKPGEQRVILKIKPNRIASMQ